MARRLDKTLVDYLVIAISPILIIVLISSLVFFLLEILYRGPFDARLRYILGLFVVGSVLVARIAIEEDRERASLFMVPLALAAFIVTRQFVDLDVLSLCGLIALILWCADKLTWDCTVIDETEPDSGEGLMQAVGLDNPPSRQAVLAPPKPETESTTARDGPPPSGPRERIADWWARFREHRRRPHAPGLWVVYFSLAALPLFGIGQLLIPSANTASRQYAFELLLVYVASGLALLLTTSFLGLRRYLRHRRLEMPVLMVNVWLVMGCLLIAGVMFFALLLPRPNAEYAISQIPSFQIGSPEQKSSPYGMGRDGVEEDRPWARTDKIDEKGTRQSNQPGDKGQAPSGQQGGKGPGQPGQQQGQQASQQAGQQQGQQPSQQAGQQSGQQQAGQQGQQAGRQEGQREGRQEGQREGQSESQPGDRARRGSPDPNRARRGSPDPAEKTDRQVSGAERKPSPEAVARSGDRPQREGDRPQRKADRPQQDRGQSQREGASGSSSSPSRQWPRLPEFNMSVMGDWFTALAKMVLYGVLIVLAIYGLCRYWSTVLAAIRDFFQGLAEFWRSLFGGGRAKAADAAAAPSAPAQPALPRFADFANPFLSGRVNRYTPAQLVTYTFQALEAWAREHGCPRQPEQTPHEFAQNVAARSAPLADGARRLAELYCQIAYASGRVPASGVEQLRQLWQSF